MQQQVFDKYASSYDEHFTFSYIGEALRKQVYQCLSKLNFKQYKNLLEVNCGTGQDALWFYNKGLNVLATDISSEMIGVAKRKAQQNNALIELRNISSADINQLQPKKFDLIFSNFGGINCLDDSELNQFSTACSTLQASGSKVILVVMGRKCVWEKLYYIFKRDLSKATRRSSRSGAVTRLGEEVFSTYYYNTSEIEEVFINEYTLIQKRPIGFFVPPSYLEHYFKNKRWLLKLLENLDFIFGQFGLLSNYSDHYLVILEKK